MSAPQCQNPRCSRSIRDDGPSTLYCCQQCSVLAAFSYEVDHRKLVYGKSRPPDEDPTCWSTRSAHPTTEKARVDEAFSWLDVRAAR